MARTNRSKAPIKTTEQSSFTWRAAGYIRLSIEDSGRPNGDTLDGQKKLVSSFVEDAPDMTLTSLYCDNGHTGTDFERPQFEKMMLDIRQGEINCIVVKDLSRFGRNYKETGNYLERIFPFLGVRFIAINDNFDTLTAERNEFGFIVPLKNLMNETYSRDISQKMRSAYVAKQGRGDFIGVWAPYGYQKCDANHNQLEPNPCTVPVVQSIFEMYLQGLGYSKIAQILNIQGIPSPSAYLYQNGFTTNEKYRNTLWAVWGVKTILNNEVYIGHMVQGKRVNTGYKQIRTKAAPPDEWRICRNTHEVIIEEDVFLAAQVLGRTKKADYLEKLGKTDVITTENIFRRRIYCSDCGRALSRIQSRSSRRNQNICYSFICPTARNLSTACTHRRIAENELVSIVTTAIHKHLHMVAELRSQLAHIWENQIALERKIIQLQTNAIQTDLARSQRLYHNLYTMLVDDLVTKEEYLSLRSTYQQEIEMYETKLKELHENFGGLDTFSPNNPLFELLDMVGEVDKLSYELIHGLIERIDYTAEGEIHITFAYQDVFENVMKRLSAEVVA